MLAPNSLHPLLFSAVSLIQIMPTSATNAAYRNGTVPATLLAIHISPIHTNVNTTIAFSRSYGKADTTFEMARKYHIFAAVRATMEVVLAPRINPGTVDDAILDLARITHDIPATEVQPNEILRLDTDGISMTIPITWILQFHA